MSGPRPLRALLTNWKLAPAFSQTRPTRDDALSQLTLAWAVAVGSGVAARSRPFKLRADTLTVLTASSAWSDELSLLAPRILEGLQRRCPQVAVRQLRFRVASGRSRLIFDGFVRREATPNSRTAERQNESAARRPEGVVAPAFASEPRDEDVSALVAGLRASQARFDSDRDDDGWFVCSSCARRFLGSGAGEALCAPCADRQRRSLDSRVERALMQAPWLQFSDLLLHVPHATRRVAERVRQRLLTRWQSELGYAERRLRRGTITPQDRVLAWSYIMLLARLPQRELRQAVVTDVLGRDWATVLLNDLRDMKREAAGPPQQKHTK